MKSSKVFCAAVFLAILLAQPASASILIVNHLLAGPDWEIAVTDVNGDPIQGNIDVNQNSTITSVNLSSLFKLGGGGKVYVRVIKPGFDNDENYCYNVQNWISDLDFGLDGSIEVPTFLAVDGTRLWPIYELVDLVANDFNYIVGSSLFAMNGLLAVDSSIVLKDSTGIDSVVDPSILPDYTGTVQVRGFTVIIPEPSSLSLLTLGGLLVIRHRRGH